MAPRAWARLFVRVRGLGEEAGFINGWIHLPLGLLIVAFHPVWSGPGLAVTLIGCGLTLKGALHFCIPALSQRTLALVSEERAWRFQAAGVVGLALAGAAGWAALV
jgi:hypothetical protein